MSDTLTPTGRKSDTALSNALAAVGGLEDLAERAAAGEWNDYFGKYGMNMNHLMSVLHIRFHEQLLEVFESNEPMPEEISTRASKINAVMGLVANGGFDAGKDEADEWAASQEGQEVKDDLGPELAAVVFGDDTDADASEEE